MSSGMSTSTPEPGNLTSVLLQCMGLSVSETGLNRVTDLLNDCGVSVTVQKFAQGIGVSYTSEEFAFTCLIPALGDKYCPLQSGAEYLVFGRAVRAGGHDHLKYLPAANVRNEQVFQPVFSG